MSTHHSIKHTLSALTVALSLLGTATAGAAPAGVGAVYAMTNEATGNRVMVFNRANDGTLTQGESFATGGLGSGQFEDSSNGLLLATLDSDSSPTNLAGDGRFVIATNAASNTVSVFRVTRDGLQLTDVEPSGGEHPVSVTVSNGVVYVLNNGDAAFAPPPNCVAGPGIPNITGFTLSNTGQLAPIANSTRPLSGDRNSGCAQVSFNPEGDVLVVTERVSDASGTANDRGVISTYTVNADGTVSGPIINRPTGIGPFGFNFTASGYLLTTENFGGLTGPGQGHAAPYDVLSNGTLVATGPSVGNGGTDTCWLVLSTGDKYAYVTNFFSSSISSYRVAADGTLTLLNPVANSSIGIGASDEATSQNGHFLYARNSLLGTLLAFRVNQDGSLTQLQTITALPINGIGLAAR